MDGMNPLAIAVKKPRFDARPKSDEIGERSLSDGDEMLWLGVGGGCGA